MSDDDDVSIISLSDDEGVPQKSSPLPQSSSAPAAPSHAGSSSSSRARHDTHAGGKQGKSGSGGGGMGASSHGGRNGTRAVKGSRVEQPPLYEGEEGEEEGYYGEGYEGEEAGEEDEYGDDRYFGDDALEDYSAFARRKREGAAPRTWLEVDEGEIREVADNLLQSINRAHQSENVLQQIFASSLAAESKELQDPLGMGAIDPLSLRLSKAGKTAGSPDKQPVVNNKWHRGKKAGGEGGEDGGGASSSEPASKKSLLPPEISPSDESFNPEQYLATFHADTSLKELRKGMKHLDAELSERTGQLKQLIKSNFERFISCKGTIDDIYLKLDKIQSSEHASSTSQLQDAIEQVQETAQSTFGDVLERAAKTDRIKSVSNLLRRFNNLFGMPGRIRSLAADGDLEQIVREYRRANALIKPSASTPNVWISLYREIEKCVSQVYDQARVRLQAPSTDVSEVPGLILFLAELTAERLPGTREEDPMRLYLQCMEDHMLMHMQGCDASLDAELSELSALMSRRLQRQATLANSTLRRVPSNGASGPEDLRQLSVTSGGEDGQQQQQLGNSGQLLVWPGPSDWTPQDALPPHLADALAERVASAAAAGAGPGSLALATAAAVAAPGATSPASPPPQAGGGDVAAPAAAAVAALASPRVTPAQFAWVKSVSRISSELCSGLPGVWAVCNSPRYAQSRGDLSGSSKRSVERAGVLGRELVERVLRGLVERAEDALEELQAAGPMQPCMELVIVDLAHTWQVLRQSGCPADCLQDLGDVLFRGLGLYTRALASLLGRAPGVLFADEDWRVSTASRDALPATQLPSRLQAVVSACMRCYSAMLHVVTQVADPPADESSAPLQDGFFATARAYCLAAAVLAAQAEPETTAEPSGTRKPSRARRRKKSQASELELDDDDDLAAAARPGQQQDNEGQQQQGQGANAGEVGTTPTAAGHGDGGGTGAGPPLVNGRRRSGALAGDGTVTAQRSDEGAASLAAAAAAAAGAGAGAAAGAGAGVPVPLPPRLLAAMSNAIALRTKVLPGMVDLHQQLLTGNAGRGERKLQQRLASSGAELQQLVATLLSCYLGLKQQQLSAALQQYLTSAKPRAALARSAPSSSSSSSRPATMPPASLHALSTSFHILMDELYAAHAEVYAYAPLMSATVMAALAAHVMSVLGERYRSLDVSSFDLEDLLQLYLDLSYLDHVLSGAMAGSERGAAPDMHLQAAYLTLASMMLRATAQKGFRARTPLARALAGVTDPHLAVARAHGICKDVVRTLVERTSLNLRCF